jgi:hypothetical protein
MESWGKKYQSQPIGRLSIQALARRERMYSQDENNSDAGKMIEIIGCGGKKRNADFRTYQN